MKLLRTLIKWLAIAFTFALIISACVSTSQEIYLGGNFCSIPCWYRLTPGQTTFEEALTIVKYLPFVSYSDYVQPTSTYISWHFTGEVFARGVITFDANRRIQEIELYPSGLTLGPVIDTFGSPETIWARLMWPRLTNFDPEQPYYLALYFPTGVLVEVADQTKDNPPGHMQDITRELNVYSIQLFAPTDLDTFLTKVSPVPISNQAILDDVHKRLKPWPGFGKDVVQVQP
jgi:hypothetical protein